MKCDICGNPATVHVCEIRFGKKTERHLCSRHAGAAEFAGAENLPPGQLLVNGTVCSSAQEAAVRGILDNLRGTRNFLRQHGRMPSNVDQVRQGMVLPDDGPVSYMMDEELLKEFGRLDATVRFIQEHGRMPESSDEWKALNTAVPTFEGWLEWLFRERDETDENDADDFPSETWLIYFARLFENCSTLLEPYSDAQVNKALRFFIDLGESDQPLSLRNLSIPWTVRRRAIESMATLFKDCFAHCSHGLSHLDEAGSKPLNGLCYMWWDIAPWHGEPEDDRFAESDKAMLDVMKQTLRIHHDACRESALHGLGHWAPAYPQAVGRIVDVFLDQNPKIRPELKAYAMQARYGGVQ
jgi:hypothetical protein